MTIFGWLKKKVIPQEKVPVYTAPIKYGNAKDIINNSSKSPSKNYTPAPKPAPNQSNLGGGSSYVAPPKPRRSGGGSSSNMTPAPTQSLAPKPSPNFTPIGGGSSYVAPPQNKLQGKTSQYDITADGRVVPKTSSNIPNQIQIQGTQDRTQFQKEFLSKSTLVPTFGTSEKPFVTKGEVQTERELQRFGVQQEYNTAIQNQYGSSGMDEETFLASDTFKKSTRIAEDKFASIQDVPGLNADPDLRTWNQKLPVLSTGKRALESTRGAASSLQSTMAAEETYGLGSISQKDQLKKTGKAVLDVGIFAADVALVTGVASGGLKAGRVVLEKSLAKELSIGAERLGSSPIIFEEAIDIGSGKLAQNFVQVSDNFVRIGQITGNSKNIGKGFSLITEGSGESLAFGSAKLTGGKRIIAKTIGSPTERFFAQSQTFDIAGASQSIKTGEIIGMEGSRSFTLSSFTPKTTYTTIFGKKELSGTLDINTRLGGSTFTSESSSGVLTKRLPKYDISFIGGKDSSGVSISTNVKQFTPKPNAITSFAKDEVKSVAGKNKFLDSLKLTESKPFVPEIKAPGRSGLITETKPIVQTETKQLGKTLSSGFKQSYRPISKPFSFQAPKVSTGLFGSVGARLGLGGLKASIGTKALTSLGTASALGTSSLLGSASLTGTASALASTSITGTSSGLGGAFIGGASGVGGAFIGGGSGGFIAGFPLPKPSIGSASGVGKFSANRIFKYTPSYSSISLGVTSSKQSKGIKLGDRIVFSGFETRAQVVTPKKKSKKKKKK